ncbi:hypothetical protein [Paludibaculum fermentans]|uniref:hypothetical protein n=1 Tax=Paludibaculum fermentans TaxID=1473598 RepID=UPI003EB84647
MRIWLRLELRPEHRSTVKTTHHVGGELAPHPSRLAIGSFDEGPGFYLLYFDEQGNEITDTFHDSIEAAQAQAAFEFDTLPGDWVVEVLDCSSE